jgi:hypothetical protein
MQRCVWSKLLILSSLLCATSVQAQAAGETGRKFPATALRGVMVFGTPPQVQLNGRSTQLAPGSRIRNRDNLQQLSGELVGAKAVVHYTTDLLGQPLQVWLLTDAERARQPWPTTAAQAQAWRFNADMQTWTQQ